MVKNPYENARSQKTKDACMVANPALEVWPCTCYDRAH